MIFIFIFSVGNLRFDTPEKVIIFRSDNQIQASGFSASVQQVECPRGIPPPPDDSQIPPAIPPATGRPSNTPSTIPPTSGAGKKR